MSCVESNSMQGESKSSNEKRPATPANGKEEEALKGRNTWETGINKIRFKTQNF